MIVKYTPATANVLTGDTFPEIQGGWQQRRGATLIATFLKSSMTRTEITGGVFVNSSVPFAFYVEEIPMAAVAVTMTDVSREGETINYQFGPEGFAKTASDLDAMVAKYQNTAAVQEMAMAKDWKNSNGGAQLGSMIGVPMLADFEANQPIQVGQQ